MGRKVSCSQTLTRTRLHLADVRPPVKDLLHIDDPLDIFAQHGLIGMLGLFFNGLLGTTEIIALDGVNISVPGGLLDRNYKQVYIQIVYILACSAYVFIVTAGIAKIFCLIPGLDLRASNHAESIGIDEDQVRSSSFSMTNLAFAKMSHHIDRGIDRGFRRSVPRKRRTSSHEQLV